MKRSARNILAIKLGFLVVFAVACAFIWWHQLNVVRPRQACLQTPGAEWFPKSRVCRVPPEFTCERNGGWWEPQTKTCARVLSIPDITGRR